MENLKGPCETGLQKPLLFFFLQSVLPLLCFYYSFIWLGVSFMLLSSENPLPVFCRPCVLHFQVEVEIFLEKAIPVFRRTVEGLPSALKSIIIFGCHGSVLLINRLQILSGLGSFRDRPRQKSFCLKIDLRFALSVLWVKGIYFFFGSTWRAVADLFSKLCLHWRIEVEILQLSLHKSWRSWNILQFQGLLCLKCEVCLVHHFNGTARPFNFTLNFTYNAAYTLYTLYIVYGDIYIVGKIGRY